MINFSQYLPAYQPVELPSKGTLYAHDSVLKSGIIHIRPYAAPEESLLYTWNADNSTMVINSILRSCIQEKVNVEEMTTEDAFFLMAWLRAWSFSQLYEFDLNCPYADCGKPGHYDVNLSTLPVTEFDETIVEPIEVVLPMTKLKAFIQCMRRGTEVKAQKRQADMAAWIDYKGDPTQLLKRAYSIRRVETPDGESTEEELEIEKLCLYYLPAADSLVIDQAIQTFKHGIDVSLDLFCRGCERIIHTELPGGPEFFRPQRAL